MAANSPVPPSVEDEKLSQATQPAKASTGFFSRKKAQPAHDDQDEKSKDVVLDGAAPAPANKVTPVSFTALFRFVPLP